MENNSSSSENCSLSKDSTVEIAPERITASEKSNDDGQTGSSYAYILYNYISF